MMMILMLMDGGLILSDDDQSGHVKMGYFIAEFILYVFKSI